MKKYDPIKVTWLDIIEDPSWQDDEEAMAFPKTLAESLGFYMGEVEEDGMTVLILLPTVFLEGDREKGTIKIPTGVIKKIERIMFYRSDK